tara:strand:- start:177 stop:647 length:471 start_codon:yes stop_codon:yes gene_type:complete
MNETTITAQIVQLEEISYKQFKKFLDSLDEERKTWSLDLQHHYKNDKEFYEDRFNMYAIVCIYDEEILGFGSYYKDATPPMIEVSFVVKKDYQSQGIGSTLLKRIEYDCKHQNVYKYIRAKHYKDNIASHKAFLKAGYKEWEKEDDTFDWKIKEIG